MISGLIGRKIGMTQVFIEGGTVEPVTAIEAGPCVVTQIKTPDGDGYRAVQLGFTEAITTRLGSRLMDAAKIDVCNVPFNVQCKAVEAKIDYHKLTDEITAEIEKLVPDRLPFPIMIFHKRNKKTSVVMTIDEFEKLLLMFVAAGGAKPR